ncbi:MAG: glycosyltransferase family 4 protein [Chloroflexota bacterium]
MTRPRPIYLGSYPPRECGIATFTRDLVAAIDKPVPGKRSHIIAMNDGGKRYDYPAAVKYQIERDDPHSYDRAAELVSQAGYQVVNVQHEYGLFGGGRGDFLFRFLDRVRQPVVITLHTVLPNPDSELRDVTQGLIGRAAGVVVLAETAVDILVRDYGISRGKLWVIPHGVPNVRPVATRKAKAALGLGDRPVLATCGLMNPGKGIEYAIDAMAGLVKEFPNLLYLVVGETHPGVRAQSGEAYREQLHEQVRRLGLEEHVQFHNRYLKYRELVLYLLAADVYVVPYLDLNQIVSGTLAYAVGCGRAVVSTPSAYAREILAGGRGLLAESRDAESIQAAVGRILRNPIFKSDLQQRAYAHGHKMIWPRVAHAYLEMFETVCEVDRKRFSTYVGPAVPQLEMPRARVG